MVHLRWSGISFVSSHVKHLLVLWLFVMTFVKMIISWCSLLSRCFKYFITQIVLKLSSNIFQLFARLTMKKQNKIMIILDTTSLYLFSVKRKFGDMNSSSQAGNILVNYLSHTCIMAASRILRSIGASVVRVLRIYIFYIYSILCIENNSLCCI